MAYFLDFDERALKEWRKLGSTVREQLKKKLAKIEQKIESAEVKDPERLEEIEARLEEIHLELEKIEDIEEEDYDESD